MFDSRFKLLFPETWPRTALAAVLIALAAFVAYHGTFSAPFVFDDFPAIVRNLRIRQLWPLGEMLSPAPGSGATAVGYPVVNLSFALNYAVGGLDVRGYHLVNLLAHIAAGVVLFALAHRVFLRPGPAARFGAGAFLPALGLAALWTLHPLQTAAVTGVGRRGEVLVGLFLLVTLYAFLRSTDDGASRRAWTSLAVVACALGMATNATMAAAPLLVLLFDRAFVAGTLREAWRRRRGLHLALAATWLLLAWLISRSGGRMAGGAWSHVLTQGHGAALCLKLAFWPEPLVFDYGAWTIRNVREAWPQLLLVLALSTAVIVALVRRPAPGFFGAGFLLTLAAGSGIISSETPALAEHRLYLPLAAVVALVAVVITMLIRHRAGVALLGLAVICAGATLRRNTDYESALTLWTDTVRKAPANPRAHYHLANALSAAGRASEAITAYETALRLEPGYAAAHHNLAGTLLQLGRAAEAVSHYEAVLRLEPGSAEAHVNLAAALIRLGRGPAAVSHYEAAARSGLLAADEQLRFGRALAEIGRIDDALARLREAQRLDPRSVETRVVLGMVLSAAGRGPEAVQHFTAAVTMDPGDANARTALADALIEADRPAEALTHYEAALRLQPGQAALLHTGIGNALIRLGRAADAIARYEEALRLNPDEPEARRNLATVRAAVQRRGSPKN